jgi:hypothetical protein
MLNGQKQCVTRSGTIGARLAAWFDLVQRGRWVGIDDSRTVELLAEGAFPPPETIDFAP